MKTELASYKFRADRGDGLSAALYDGFARKRFEVVRFQYGISSGGFAPFPEVVEITFRNLQKSEGKDLPGAKQGATLLYPPMNPFPFSTAIAEIQIGNTESEFRRFSQNFRIFRLPSFRF